MKIGLITAISAALISVRMASASVAPDVETHLDQLDDYVGQQQVALARDYLLIHRESWPEGPLAELAASLDLDERAVFEDVSYEVAHWGRGYWRARIQQRRDRFRQRLRLRGHWWQGHIY